jgi:alanine dehydrogenase
VIIGIPKEIKDQEFRVALTPFGARRLVDSGHAIFIEKGAGVGSGFLDLEYQRSGAKIVRPHQAVFEKSEFIIKVKEPLPREYPLLAKNQILFAFLHLAANPVLGKRLEKQFVRAIAYEAVENQDGSLPILKPMSEVAGRMAVLIGAGYLSKERGGSGILLSGTPTVEGGHVVILGAGTVGENALHLAIQLGAQVHLFDRNEERLQKFAGIYGSALTTNLPSPSLIERALLEADLAIGAIHLPREKTPHLVSKKMVSRMKKGSVIVDVSIDQGGCFETSRPTTHSNPVYTVHGVCHYCVPNIPGIVSRTATVALTQATLPFICEIADKGLPRACRENRSLAKGGVFS